mmetsp:Transcript_38409/g.80689  ORF Transcript_38409/g.80689 Transcript_38409/m.80689 type:complete len:174 (+) Transcript_38409:176-697(+)
MLAARYKAADPSWDADVLFKELQHERAVTRVPFFLYDEEDLKIGWREDISKLHQCVQWSRYKHGNDADFLLQLSDHHWRTRNASEADFLVVPVALGAACVSWFSCGYTFSQALPTRHRPAVPLIVPAMPADTVAVVRRLSTAGQAGDGRRGQARNVARTAARPHLLRHRAAPA